jgi:hypothetical protein
VLRCEVQASGLQHLPTLIFGLHSYFRIDLLISVTSVILFLSVKTEIKKQN